MPSPGAPAFSSPATSRLTLLLAGVLLVSAVTGCQRAPDDAIPLRERESLLLLRGVLAVLPSSGEIPPPDTLRQLPAVRLPLEQYIRQYPAATQGQLAWLRWWSGRYQDADLQPGSAIAASLVPLLLPPPEPATLDSWLRANGESLFQYDPPLHQPAVDALALLGSFVPRTLPALYGATGDFPEARLGVAEQALSRLLLACDTPTDVSLTPGLPLAAAALTPDDVSLLRAAWINKTLAQLQSEMLLPDALGPDPRVFGQPFASAGRVMLLLLLEDIPPNDPRLQHPALLQTLILTLRSLAQQRSATDPAAESPGRWLRVLDARYPDSALTQDPAFGAALEQLRQITLQPAAAPAES